MDAQLKALLKPEILNTMNGLELVARIMVEGYMSGSNKSNAIGTGQEFSQYRNYEPGDDLRQLDWKMYARSGRYYIKQAEIETNITVKFMIDGSQSMAYTESGLTKFELAKVLCAALLYLARKQGDTFGVYLVNDVQITEVHPRFEQQQFMRTLHALAEATPAGRWEKGPAVEHLLDHQGKEMMIFFTDLYDDEDDIFRFIQRLKTPRNEVMVFHLLGRQERDLNHRASVTFEDLERQTQLKVNTAQQQQGYREKMESWLHNNRQHLLSKGIHLEVVMMDSAPEHILREFLKVRKNLAAG